VKAGEGLIFSVTASAFGAPIDLAIRLSRQRLPLMRILLYLLCHRAGGRFLRGDA
jgi:hypothetical protein